MNDVALKIIAMLRKEDKPLIAYHIAKAVKESPQLVDYHLKKLVDEGVVLTVEEYGSKHYILQPSFYMEEAETTLMEILLPWVKEFAKQTELTDEMASEPKEIVLKNLHYYFLLFMQDLPKLF